MLKIHKRRFIEERRPPTREEVVPALVNNLLIPKEMANFFYDTSPKYARILAKFFINMMAKYWVRQIDLETSQPHEGMETFKGKKKIKNDATAKAIITSVIDYFTKVYEIPSPSNDNEKKFNNKIIGKMMSSIYHIRGTAKDLPEKEKMRMSHRFKKLFSGNIITGDGEKIPTKELYKKVAYWMENQTKNPHPSHVTYKIKTNKQTGVEKKIPAREEIDYQHLNWDSAYGETKKWFDFIDNKEVDLEEGTIYKRYPDGFYWVDLGPGVHCGEAFAMGACGHGFVEEPLKSGNYISHLFSLRDSGHIPKASFDVDVRNGDVWQIVGPVNTKPKEKYHPYIVDLMLDKNLVKTLKVEDSKIVHMFGKNLTLEDLSPELLGKIKQERPDLIKDVQEEPPIEQPPTEEQPPSEEKDDEEIEESFKFKIYKRKYGVKRN